MGILKGYRYRIKPNAEQRELIERTFGCCRFVYNKMLEARIAAYAVDGRSLSKAEMTAMLPAMKQEYPWLAEVNAQSLQQEAIHLDAAFTRFFREKKGFPRFKSRKTDRPSFGNPQKTKIDFDAGLLSIVKAKGDNAVRAVFHRRFDGKVKNVTVSRSATGKYYATVLVETTDELPVKAKPVKASSVGIDLGIKSFLTTSEGEKIDNPRILKRSSARLAREQRKLSRKKPGSSNRTKQRRKVARIHEKIGQRRSDFLHKTSTRFAHDSQVGSVCVEDLNVVGMLKNRRLSKAISDVGWGTFLTMLRYKCDWVGKHLLDIGRFAPSSKTCSVCGSLKADLTLGDRTWVCTSCDTEHDRDVNAARNIRSMAFDRQNLLRILGLDLPEETPVETSGC